MARADEAARHRDFRDAHRGLAHQGGGVIEPHAEIMIAERGAEPFGEQPLELPHRQTGAGGEILAGPRLLDRLLHRLQNTDQARVVGAEPLAGAEALGVARGPLLGAQEPFADREGEGGTVIAGDQREHHVERGDAAGAGDAVAVDLVEGAAHLEIGEILHEGRNVLPVERAAPPREQACAGEHEGPARHAGDQGHAVAGEAAQPGERLAVAKSAGFPPAQTNSASSATASPTLASGAIRMPFEASIGSPSIATWHHR